MSVEALDELAKVALINHPHKETITKQIEKITQQGMNGDIPFSEALGKRLKLFSLHKDHIAQVISKLQTLISPSIEQNRQFFKQYAQYIYIISGGFKEYISPIASSLGILENHILANEFIFDTKGNVLGYNKKNPLSQDKGKIKVIQQLHLKGNVTVIGDGYTDYQIKEAGLANEFIAYTENIIRPNVTKKADKTIKNFDEFLHYYNFPRSLSYPKSKIKVLLLENIHQVAIEQLKQEGYQVESLSTSLSEEELVNKIEDISLLGIRSKTEISKKVLDQAKKLLSIGAFCIGTNQIDLTYATQKGVCVFNAPYSNTRSVVELVMGEIIMLYRRVFDKSNKLHKGIWDKSAKNSFEVRGKKLGIIGYGNIGTQLSVLAENFGMKVYFYDINDKLALGNAIKCTSLEELLKIADVITVHVDGKKSNTNMIGDREFSLMKKGVIFLNLSRGFVVDIDALSKYIKNGKISGTAIDVFPKEPKSNAEQFSTPLQNLPNVILTPHVGGSTEEAQYNIGEFVANKMISFVNTGNTTLSVNFPNLTLPNQINVHRFIHIHKNEPGILAQINRTLAKYKINIVGQYLKTNEEIGYVITDVITEYNMKVLTDLKHIPMTIRVRILY